jgi:2-isopropylmalate synthase
VTNDGRVNPQYGSGHTQVFHGNAAESDVIVASTKAYLAALNRLLAMLGTYEKTESPDAPARASAN